VATSGLVLDGGTLGVIDRFTTARAVTLDAGGGTIETAGAQATFTGAILGIWAPLTTRRTCPAG